jgi:hypothetical protein
MGKLIWIAQSEIHSSLFEIKHYQPQDEYHYFDGEMVKWKCFVMIEIEE